MEITVLNSGQVPGTTPNPENDNPDINNDSIVLHFTYGDVDFVIGGDAEFVAEASMLQSFSAEELEVEYFKAHHHGLDDANGGGWVSALRPRVSFVPVAETFFSFGSFEGRTGPLVQTLEGVGAHAYFIDDIEVLDVDRSGGALHNITFVTDGISYEVHVELATQPVFKHSAHAASCIGEDRGPIEDITLGLSPLVRPTETP